MNPLEETRRMDHHPLIPAAISILASTPSVMRAMLAPLPDAVISAPGNGGWSARDVVAHLAARQQIAIAGRINAVLEHPGAAMPALPQSLMDVTHYRSRPLDDVLNEFEQGRVEAMAPVEGLMSEHLQLKGVIPALGEVTIAEVIHHVAFHDLVHISQAAQLASAPLEPLRGAMRAFR